MVVLVVVEVGEKEDEVEGPRSPPMVNSTSSATFRAALLHLKSVRVRKRKVSFDETKSKWTYQIVRKNLKVARLKMRMRMMILHHVVILTFSG